MKIYFIINIWIRLLLWFYHINHISSLSKVQAWPNIELHLVYNYWDYRSLVQIKQLHKLKTNFGKQITFHTINHSEINATDDIQRHFDIKLTPPTYYLKYGSFPLMRYEGSLYSPNLIGYLQAILNPISLLQSYDDYHYLSINQHYMVYFVKLDDVDSYRQYFFQVLKYYSRVGYDQARPLGFGVCFNDRIAEHYRTTYDIKHMKSFLVRSDTYRLVEKIFEPPWYNEYGGSLYDLNEHAGPTHSITSSNEFDRVQYDGYTKPENFLNNTLPSTTNQFNHITLFLITNISHADHIPYFERNLDMFRLLYFTYLYANTTVMAKNSNLSDQTNTATHKDLKSESVFFAPMLKRILQHSSTPKSSSFDAPKDSPIDLTKNEKICHDINHQFMEMFQSTQQHQKRIPIYAKDYVLDRAFDAIFALPKLQNYEFQENITTSTSIATFSTGKTKMKLNDFNFFHLFLEILHALEQEHDGDDATFAGHRSWVTPKQICDKHVKWLRKSTRLIKMYHWDEWKNQILPNILHYGLYNRLKMVNEMFSSPFSLRMNSMELDRNFTFFREYLTHRLRHWFHTHNLNRIANESIVVTKTFCNHWYQTLLAFEICNTTYPQKTRHTLFSNTTAQNTRRNLTSHVQNDAIFESDLYLSLASLYDTIVKSSTALQTLNSDIQFKILDSNYVLNKGWLDYGFGINDLTTKLGLGSDDLSTKRAVKTAALIYNAKNHAKFYLAPEHFNAINLTKFLTSFTEGTLPRALFSFSPPNTHYTALSNKLHSPGIIQHTPITELNSTHFEPYINNPTKDVFVMFYTHFCGFCISIANLYTLLALDYAKTSSVSFSRINCARNDLPMKHLVKYYPTLTYYPAYNKNQSIQFSYDRSWTMRELRNFVATCLSQNRKLIVQSLLLHNMTTQHWLPDGQSSLTTYLTQFSQNYVWKHPEKLVLNIDIHNQNVLRQKRRTLLAQIKLIGMMYYQAQL